MNNKIVEKHFPADTSMEQETFLNDNSIDAELFSIFQIFSEVKSYKEDKVTKYYTIVKKRCATREELATMLGKKGKGDQKYLSTKTISRKIKRLVERGYLKEFTTEMQSHPGYKLYHKGYYLIEAEVPFFGIELETLRELQNACVSELVKAYIYLGQKWKWVESIKREQTKQGAEVRDNYTFTLEELGEHIGFPINHHPYLYQKMKDILSVLERLGLIQIAHFYTKNKEGNPVPQIRLVHFNFRLPERK